MRSVKVEIHIPADWRASALYVLREQVTVGGFVVPSGFATDGASIPRMLWPIFPPVGEYFLAAVVHDFALAEGCSWERAAGAFDGALKEVPVSSWRRKIMVAAVRLYGWVARKP